MDAPSTAATMAANRQAELQSTIAAELTKMRAQHTENVVGMLETSASQMKQHAAPPPLGAGGNVDTFA